MGLGFVAPASELLLPLVPIAGELAVAGQQTRGRGWPADRLTIRQRSARLLMLVPRSLGHSVILDLVDTRTQFRQNISAFLN